MKRAEFRTFGIALEEQMISVFEQNKTAGISKPAFSVCEMVLHLTNPCGLNV
jgi:hypothetical protein